MAAEGEEDTQYLKLSIEDRCQHKLWKARVSGYEDSKRVFELAADPKAPEFSKFLGLIKKFIVESNPVAQEKGLDAALAFIKTAAVAGKTTAEVVSGIVQKCFIAPKVKTRDKIMEVILTYVEIEKYEIVQDELLKGLDNKSPKVVSACIHSLTEILRNFGQKVLTLKPIAKIIPKLLEDRDKNVREETKQLTIEIYRWIGAQIKPQLQNLKPVQLNELEKEFEKVSSEQPTKIRYLRSQQEAKLIAEGAAAENADEGEDDEAAETQIDPLEFVEPVDILSKLPKDFFEKCESKWQDRKSAMESLAELVANPKLEPGDYGDLVKAVKKIISKDSNLIIVGLAGKCLAGLANGLKKKFQSYVTFVLPAVLEKFKEKKPTVLQPLRDAADAVYACTTLEAITDELISALQNKNPCVRAETVSFVSRIFSKCTPAVLNKKTLKIFCPVILKTLNDADGVVRDNAAVALGTAMKVVGEKVITPFMPDLDSLKQAKIKECCEKAEVVKRPSGKSKAAKTAPQRKDPKAAATSAAAKPSPPPDAERSPAESKPSKPSKTDRPKEKVVRGKGKKTKASAAPETKPLPTERELSKEEAAEAVELLLSADILSGLTSSQWQDRLSAIEKFSEIIQSAVKDQIPAQALVIILREKPGFKDTNFQVLNLKFQTLGLIAKRASLFSQTTANSCLSAIIDKIGDAKAGPSASEALSLVAEATNLKFVSSEAMGYAFSQKNPKNQVEAINWLATAIKEFGFDIDLKPTINLTKKGLAATNPAIRAACISLIGVMFMYMGQALRTFYEDEKAALLQLIDAEFEKVSGTRPPAPTRGILPGNVNHTNGNDQGSDRGGGAVEVNLADLMPRSDFGAQIPSSVINELADKDWKVRGKALDELKALLSELKFITPNLGELLIPLRSRLNETNKNLLIQFLNFTQSLGAALGPGTKQHVRVLIPAVFSALGDNKNTVRSAALSCLQTWTENAGFVTLVDGEMLIEALKLENPFSRTEILGWLIEELNSAKAVPNSELNLLVPTLFSCIEDRSADVRKKAQDAVLPFMIHLGCETLGRAAGKLKPSSKPIITAHLDKAKAILPAKPVKSKSSGKVPKTVKEDVNGNSPVNPSRTSPPSKDNKRAPSKTRKPDSAPAKSKKKDEEVEVGPPLPSNNLKDQRLADEKGLKVLRWNFTIPREEFFEQLKDQMLNAGFSRSLQTNMFHSDFKFHLKAIDTLIECIDSCPDGVMSNVDLILKWITLRFFDTNPSVLLKALEFLQMLFNLLQKSSHHLSELDASSFIPYLILKVGDPKDPVRKGVREIFKLLCKVYPSNKMFSFLMQGLASKNARQRTECLDELANLIEMYGMTVCQPSAGSALKEIAKQIADRDNSVRNAALNCVVQAYFIENEKVYKLIGHLNDKDMSLLEERIKRASRNRPVVAPSAPKMPEPKPVKSCGNRQSPATQQSVATKPLSTYYNNAAGEAESLEVRKRVPSLSASSRPISCGPFTLDYDSIEQMVGISESSDKNACQVDLVDVSDVFQSIPVLPKSRSTPSSPAQKILNMSSDAASSVDFVMSQISSHDIKTIIGALSQILELLQDAEKAESMLSRVDKLLLTISSQYRMVCISYMSDPNTSKYEVTKLYRLLTTTLIVLFGNNALAKAATTDVLRDLIYNLLGIIVDSRLEDLDEGSQVVRTLNVLMVKVVVHSHHTNVLCALIKLLQECSNTETQVSINVTELVMKCLWKVVRMMPDIITSSEIDLNRILYDIHIFLQHFPFAVWKKRSIDTPIRTIKTVLHSLAKLEGSKILNHLTLIENTNERSEVEVYLQKVLRGTSKHQSRIASSDLNSPDVVADARNATRREVKAVPRGISKQTHESLSAIFKKIGLKEHSKQGLLELYDFKQKYPEASIDPFIKKSSQFFQNYVESGLKAIEQEKNNNTATANINLTRTVTKTTAIETSTTSTNPDLPPASVYMERLKVIRARYGLDNAKSERNAKSIAKTNATMPVDASNEDGENTPVSLSTNMNNLERRTTTDHLEEGSNRAYFESINKV